MQERSSPESCKGKLGLPRSTFVHKSATGFTLVEMIIYVAIVSLIAVSLIDVADIVQTSRQRFTVLNLVHNTASRVINSIEALIRNSDGFVTDASDRKCVFPNKLWLYYATSSRAFTPPGCMGQYASGAIGLESYSFSGATSTSPDSPRNAQEGYGSAIDSKYIYTVGSLNSGWHISKRYLDDMSYSTGFGTSGAVSSSGNYGARAIAQDGQYLYIVGGNEADGTTNDERIEKRRIDNGALCTAANCGIAFDTDGIITSANSKILKSIVIDSTYIYVAGYKWNSGSSQNDWVIEKLRLDTGALETAFDTDGIINNGLTNGTANAVALDTGNNYLYIMGDSGGSRTIERRNATSGALDTSFATSGRAQTAGGTYNGAVLESNSLYVTGGNGSDLINEKYSVPVSGSPYGRPASDITTGWTTAPLWSKIDESSADDADFIVGSATDDGTVSEVKLSSLTDPLSSSSHVFRYRAKKAASSAKATNLQADIYQGATLIASFTGSVTASFATYTQTLTAGQADSITDYSDLRMRFTCSGDSTNFPFAKACNLSWAEFQIPATSSGTLDTSFGTSGVVTAAAATTAGFGMTMNGQDLYIVGHSSNDWYMEKRLKTTGALETSFGTSGSITDDSNTDIPYGGVTVDDNYIYIVGTTVVSGTRYQYTEKRARSSGAFDARSGVRMLCYQDYPNNGKAADCTSDPPHDAVFRTDMTDPLQLFVGLGDLTFTTTTVGSQSGIEALLNIKYLGDLRFNTATYTASTTTAFRISNP